MLRAMIADTPFEQRWVLQGRLCGESAADLTQKWAKTRNTRQGRRCVVDVEDVVWVDDEGERLLLQMKSEGSEVVASGVYMKHLLDSLNERQGQGRSRVNDVSQSNAATRSYGGPSGGPAACKKCVRGRG
jgi:hypothetical protein